jgi:hypothetical protein
MTMVRHLNCGTLHAPPNPPAACHSLLIEGPNGLALVDTGIGLRDVRNPGGRIGRQLITLPGSSSARTRRLSGTSSGLGFAPETCDTSC